MYCCNCGKRLEEDDRFCDNCGTPVYEEESELSENPGKVESEAGSALAEGFVSEGESLSGETSFPVEALAFEEESVSGEALAPEETIPGEKDPVGRDSEKEEILEKKPDPKEVPAPEEAPEGIDPVEDGAAFSDLEKRIMKNMEDELILEAPYGAGQRQHSGPPPYGNGNGAPSPYPVRREEPQWRGQAYSQEAREKMPKKKKAWIITLSCMVAALLIAVVVFVFLILSPGHKLKKSIEDRDWASVSSLYEEHFKGNGKKEEEANEIFRETVEALKQDFIDGTMDYSTVKRHLKAMEDFWEDSFVEDALDFVRELGDSRQAFEDAGQCMKREEYEDAIRLYGEVVKTDANYQAAQENLETAKTKYKEKLLGEAGAYEEVRDYDSAIALVEAGLLVLSGDIELASRLEELQEAQQEYGIEAVLTKARDFASQNHYFEAMDTVRAGLLETPGNEKLESALKEHSEAYKNDILSKAEAAVGGDENYEAAILVFDSALRTLSGDYAEVEQALREKREEYVRLQLEKSERENAESAIIGVWKGVMVSSEGMDIPMDQFLALSGMSGTNAMISCQPSGAFHIEFLGEIGDGTWSREESGNGLYYLNVDGDIQAVQIDNSGRLRMDLNGIVLVFEKTGEA